MKYILSLSLALFCFSSLHAQQFQFDGELGVNVTGAFVKDPGGNPHGSPLPGLQLGLSAQYPLPSSHLGIGARLLYSNEGYQPIVYDTKATIHVSFLKIPVNLLYRSAKDTKWTFGLGPYFAFGLGGNYKSDNTNNNKIKINFGNNPDKDDLKRMDLGADLMAGYQLNDQFMVRGALDMGLIDYLTPGSSQNASAHSFSFGISICYLGIGK